LPALLLALDLLRDRGLLDLFVDRSAWRWQRSRRVGGGSNQFFRRLLRKWTSLLGLTRSVANDAERSFGSIHWTCLTALVTDRVMEAWYYPSIA